MYEIIYFLCKILEIYPSRKRTHQDEDDARKISLVRTDYQLREYIY